MTKTFCDKCGNELGNLQLPRAERKEFEESMDGIKVYLQIEPDRFAELCEVCRDMAARIMIQRIMDSMRKFLPEVSK